MKVAPGLPNLRQKRRPLHGFAAIRRAVLFRHAVALDKPGAVFAASENGRTARPTPNSLELISVGEGAALGAPDGRMRGAATKWTFAEPVYEEPQRSRRPSAAPTRRAGPICFACLCRASSSCLSVDTTSGALLGLLASRPGATPCPTEMSS